LCHSDDSRPPGPPNPGGVAEHGPLVLTAEDGNKSDAYLARPETPNGMNVVLLPDRRGKHPFYDALAQRFAEAGFTAIAFDYFGRTAGLGPRAEDFDWQEHLREVQPAHVRADAAAALGQLDGAPTFSVGFCFGGSHSWRLAGSELDLAGCVGFYGKPSMVEDVLPEFHRPLLMLVAGADAATPTTEFHAMEERLTEQEKPHDMHIYEGAPHSFFDVGFAQWQDACADAWRRIIEFTERYR